MIFSFLYDFPLFLGSSLLIRFLDLVKTRSRKLLLKIIKLTKLKNDQTHLGISHTNEHRTIIEY